MNKLFVLLLVLGVTFVPVLAQEQSTQQATTQPTPTAEELEKQKAERQKNAYRLLDQIIDESQSLRLPENRVRVQTTAADLLWDSNQGRARSLFSMAAESVAEIGRQQQNTNTNRRPGPQNNDRRAFQLRQELVLAAARHDAQLAYQLLATTKPAAFPMPTNTDPRMPRPQVNPEDNLEQILLSRIAALDPKFAAQNAEQMIDKGQFPRSVSEVIFQLYKQDADAAAKLADKTVKKLQATNLLANNEAVGLAQTLLMIGPRRADNAPLPEGVRVDGRRAILDEGLYSELLGTVVDMAVKATLQAPQTNQRTQGQRGRPVGATVAGPGYVQTGPMNEAQVEQASARRLLATLQTALPLIDRYLPSKSATVRQKLTEAGMPVQQQPSLPQNANLMVDRAVTSDSLIQAAATAQPQMQPRLYQQAAMKALEEGNIDRARQIATDYLQGNVRDFVLQRVSFTEIAKKGESARLDEIRQAIGRLQTDDEKISLLLQLGRDLQQTNPKIANQLLDDAKQMTNHRATSYEQFEQQLRVARAFAEVDTARTFEVLDPAISQLNELLSAAVVLNGFEVNMFRDGEMSLQAGNGLTSMIQRFGGELGMLADKDLERAETLASRFQFAEPRIMSRLAIVQGLLKINTSSNRPNIGGGTATVRN
jgi:hypothetical protein